MEIYLTEYKTHCSIFTDSKNGGHVISVVVVHEQQICKLFQIVFFK